MHAASAVHSAPAAAAAALGAYALYAAGLRATLAHEHHAAEVRQASNLAAIDAERRALEHACTAAEVARHELAEAQAQLDASKAALRACECERDSARDEAAALRAEGAAAARSCDELRRELDRASDEIEDFTSRERQSSEQIDALELERAALTFQLATLQEAMDAGAATAQRSMATDEAVSPSAERAAAALADINAAAAASLASPSPSAIPMPVRASSVATALFSPESLLSPGTSRQQTKELSGQLLIQRSLAAANKREVERLRVALAEASASLAEASTARDSAAAQIGSLHREAAALQDEVRRLEVELREARESAPAIDVHTQTEGQLSCGHESTQTDNCANVTAPAASIQQALVPVLAAEALDAASEAAAGRKVTVRVCNDGSLEFSVAGAQCPVAPVFASAAGSGCGGSAGGRRFVPASPPRIAPPAASIQRPTPSARELTAKLGAFESRLQVIEAGGPLRRRGSFDTLGRAQAPIELAPSTAVLPRTLVGPRPPQAPARSAAALRPARHYTAPGLDAGAAPELRSASCGRASLGADGGRPLVLCGRGTAHAAGAGQVPGAVPGPAASAASAAAAAAATVAAAAAAAAAAASAATSANARAATPSPALASAPAAPQDRAPRAVPDVRRPELKAQMLAVLDEQAHFPFPEVFGGDLNASTWVELL